jgi:hypothetical protein
MKNFTVDFHKGDAIGQMTVQKLTEEDFNRVTEQETRQLFELDTDVGFFIFFDAQDEQGHASYLMLHYEGENENPSACYGFELKDFYQFTALYLNDLQFGSEAEEVEYGPIQHLAHLLHHVLEEGKTIQV